jgi:hypothetical protein
MIARVVERTGRGARESLEGLGRAGRFAVESAAATCDVALWWPQTAPQAVELGVRSLPIGMFIAVFTGIVLALLASYSVSGAVPLYFVGTLVEKTSLLAHSDSVMRRLHAGEGSVGLFLTDSSVYRQTDSLLTQLRRLVADVQSNPRKYLRVSVF